MAADGTPRTTWHGKDFASTTEIVKLGEIEVPVRVPDLPDGGLRQMIAALVACERIEGANRIAPAHFLELTACRFIEEGGTVESWRRYETELGVAKSKTRQPRSPIQPFIRWLRGGEPDWDGIVSLLSAAFDAWLAEKNRPEPTPRNSEPGTSGLAKWLADNHGYQAVAKAHNARLEHEAALKRGTTPSGSSGGFASTVWVTHASGTERVYDSKAAAQSQKEGPACEELAESRDRIDPETDDEDEDDPLPERINGTMGPEYHHRPGKNCSEANFDNGSSASEPIRPSWRFPSARGEVKYLAFRAKAGSEEWYTPERVFKSLNCAFDLDPASPGKDVVPWIPTKRHFTLADNGLERDWSGNFVWLNPPYARETLPQWLEKFRKHGNGIALVVDRTSAGWWQELCSNADLILQVNKKINFMRPTNETGTNALGSSLVGYGERAVKALMNAAAAELGTLFEPYRKSRARSAALERAIDNLKARITELENREFRGKSSDRGIEPR